MTTQQLYNDFLHKLNRVYEAREAVNITDWILENVSGLKRFERNINTDFNLSNEQKSLLNKYLVELMNHKPVQYVLNEAWFYKMKFYVNEHVLIPRPETEELVQWIVEDVRSKIYEIQNKELEILDIGTGSGCIPISLKKEIENLRITAVDISEDALKVANKNARALHTEINFIQLNFLDERFWNKLRHYDIIVSNPPYIAESEKKELAENVAAFEPAIALFVPDSSPFIFYEKIAKFAQSHLDIDGHVYVEIHENYSKEIKQIFSAYSFDIEIKKDIYGKNRMIRAFKL